MFCQPLFGQRRPVTVAELMLVVVRHTSSALTAELMEVDLTQKHTLRWSKVAKNDIEEIVTRLKQELAQTESCFTNLQNAMMNMQKQLGLSLHELRRRVARVGDQLKGASASATEKTAIGALIEQSNLHVFREDQSNKILDLRSQAAHLRKQRQIRALLGIAEDLPDSAPGEAAPAGSGVPNRSKRRPEQPVGDTNGMPASMAAVDVVNKEQFQKAADKLRKAVRQKLEVRLKARMEREFINT